MSVTKELSDLAAEYEAAKENYERAERLESQARSDRCQAANRLTAAQKAWDAYTEKLRKDAPWDSHWRSKQGQPVNETR